jgi:glycosyltransferase involved in cell wall biosynthesis
MQKIIIVSTCIEDWGGSEELWGRSVPFLLERGYQLSVVKQTINRNHPEFVKLGNNNVNLIEISPALPLPQKLNHLFSKSLRRVAEKLKLVPHRGESFEAFKKIITAGEPSLVLISQGINFDGLKLAYQCHLLGVPYVVLSQKAVDFYWPLPYDRAFMLTALQHAEQCFFVSKHNLRLTEEQFGKRLTNAMVIFNPMKLSGEIVPYPGDTKMYKFACVGRLFLLDKGQDILIRILAEQKWKDRPVHVSFMGKGLDESGLKDMAKLLGVTNVEFKGHLDDVESMWTNYHALVLPSRSEGLPLSIVEAMSAGRMVIVSDAGGNTEIVEEGRTGFVGAPYERSFGDAMERAWEKRDEWQLMGKNAAAHVAKHVPESPEKVFVALLTALIK